MMGPMSAIGPKRTSQIAPHLSAFGGKVDAAGWGKPGKITLGC
jgi:hypothetical protein